MWSVTPWWVRNSLPKELTSQLDPKELQKKCARQRGAARAKVLRQESWLVERVERRSTRQAEEEGC